MERVVVNACVKRMESRCWWWMMETSMEMRQKCRNYVCIHGDDMVLSGSFILVSKYMNIK